MCRCKKGYRGSSQLGREAVCTRITSPKRQPPREKSDDPLLQVQRSIVELEFITAIVETLDIFFKNETTPCSGCFQDENRLGQCTDVQLKFCLDLNRLTTNYYKDGQSIISPNTPEYFYVCGRNSDVRPNVRELIRNGN